MKLLPERCPIVPSRGPLERKYAVNETNFSSSPLVGASTENLGVRNFQKLQQNRKEPRYRN